MRMASRPGRQMCQSVPGDTHTHVHELPINQGGLDAPHHSATTARATTNTQRTISGWWKRLWRPFDKKQKPLVDGIYSLFLVEYLERTQSSNLLACLFRYSRSGIFDHKQHPRSFQSRLRLKRWSSSFFCLVAYVLLLFLMFLWSWVHSCL
jgi:hypothetical protein